MEQKLWVRTWGTAMQPIAEEDLPPQPGLSYRTLRQIIRPSIGGDRLRLTLSNQYGEDSVMLLAVRLALSSGGNSIYSETNQEVTFNGRESVIIPSGETITSDPIQFELPKLSNLTITLSFGETPEQITGHAGSRTDSYIQAGNVVDVATMLEAVKIERWFFIAGLDVQADIEHRSVVALGDSITDGRGVVTNFNQRWTDYLANRLQQYSATSNVGVINMGIGGNAVLDGGLGPTASLRFERDVLQQPGVRYLIIAAGINDIGNASALDITHQLTDRLKDFIHQARDRSIRVYGTTFTPFGGSQYDNEIHEEIRQRMNHWIRTSGAFDAVIDYDEAIRDPLEPSRLSASYDSGDHLHPSPAGYQRMAEAIDYRLFID